MSTMLRIPSEPTWVIVPEDDGDYNVPLWANGVKLNDTVCLNCTTRIGPYNEIVDGEITVAWIPVYHQYTGKQALLCRDCVEQHWWHRHENLLLVAEHLQDMKQVFDMLEKPWRYVDEWWEAFGIEQDENLGVTQ